MNTITPEGDTISVHDQHSGQELILFAHGLLDAGESQLNERALYKAGNAAKNKVPAGIEPRYTIPSNRYAYFNFDDAFVLGYGIKLCNIWHLSFGQQNDIEKLMLAYTQTVKKRPGQPIIGYGVSRGASVWASTAATHELNAVKALVLESPFDKIQTSLKAAADHIPAVINYGITRALAEYIITTAARKYKVDAQQPIDVIKKIPTDMPVLIVCSREDKLVPAYSSYLLYEALRDSGHKHAYVLVLEKGGHAKILPGQNGQQYEQVVHAFYKKYGFHHDPTRAAQGESLLAQCQPTGSFQAQK